MIIPLLIITVALLPPFNALQQLDFLNYTRISASGGSLKDPDGTVVSFPSDGVDSAFFANLKSTPMLDFQASQQGSELYDAAKNMPVTILPRSPIYKLRTRGTSPSQVNLRIPIPNDSKPYTTLSLYNWDGSSWNYLPSEVLDSEDVIEADLTEVPSNFMVVQTTSAVPAATVDIGTSPQAPANAVATYEAKAGLALRGDGALEGVAPTNDGGKTLPVIRNWQGSSLQPESVRTDLLYNMLSDPGMMDNQVTAVRETVVQNGYPGVIIDYRGVDPQPTVIADYVHLIRRIAQELHANGKTIAVRVDTPNPIAEDRWDTGGYDWRNIGKDVDTVVIPAPVDPRAYQPGGEMEAMLQWAVSQIDRSKIQIEFSGQSIERSGVYLLPKGYKEALQPLVQKVKLETVDNQATVSLDNPTLMNNVTWDPTIGAYSYKYIDAQGLERTVYIENEGSFKHKLSVIQNFNVRNVNLQVPANGDIDPNLWNVVLQFQEGVKLQAEQTPINLAFVVYGPDGKPMGQTTTTMDNPKAVINMPAGGDVKIEAQLSDAKGNLITKSLSSALKAVQAVAAKVAAPADTSTAAAPAAPSQTATVDKPRLVGTNIVNVREGPGTIYNTLGQIQPGGSFEIIGKNQAGDWWQIALPNGNSGWVIGQLVNTLGDVSGVQLAQNIPEAPQQIAAAAAPANTGGGEVKPEAPAPQAAAAAPPVVSAPAPAGGIPFGYGIQAHMIDTSDGMISQVMGSAKGLGFGWVKSQIEWKRFEDSAGAPDFGPMDPIINAANAQGLNVFFSVVGAPAWARESGFDGNVGGPPADPNTYASFVGKLAGKYCGSSLKAIEVWNEENLHYEWGNRPLNPGDYVRLLAAAYASIKAACPSMYVVSGALTPAGNNGSLAVDDFTYLEGMFQAGAANYMDSVGAHPSGYNVPPWATWDTACAEIQKSGNSFNGACDSPHHSWSYRSTMEGYRAIAVKYGAADKTIVASEFGWAAGGAFNPNYAYANDNDFDEQATWTVEAYKMAKAWGWAGPMILWNLNFRVVADGTEKAQWGIVKNDWTPLPAFSALASMPK
ncbi:MAG: SH3 domain-containing protein [Caldilineaceae bacterium]